MHQTPIHEVAQQTLSPPQHHSSHTQLRPQASFPVLSPPDQSATTTSTSTAKTNPSSGPPSSPSPPHASSSATSPIPASFTRRKAAILSQLARPEGEYTDLSPKGTVDAGIRDLIDEVNGCEGFVTTSSCAGRVSVFLEGKRRDQQQEQQQQRGKAGEGQEEEEQQQLGNEGGGGGGDDVGDGDLRTPTVAGVGGKGGGGRWLFVSHDPVETHGKLDCEPNIVAALLGMEEPIFDGREGSSAEEMSGGGSRLIHFKFEPMILHVLTASPQHAQLILSCGLQAGFRESGAINLTPSASSSLSSSSSSAATPIVAIRSMGLSLESLIGRETNGIKHCTVSGEYLRALINIANERFVENAKRIERFRRLLRAALEKGEGSRKTRVKEDGTEWEDAEARKERKRAEGLRRAEEVKRLKEQQRGQVGDDDIGGLEEIEQA